MSLRLRRIALESFKKFRTPMVLEGLTDGLNIVIEDNETGKSTLLEALRAAFFVRHNTKNQLAQSYAPHGDAVGPKVEISFETQGEHWSVSKRFLRSPNVEVNGPLGRAQGEEAEVRLNQLLGSVKDTSRAGDIASYGALGMLWVAQAEALSVSAPGQIVRDSVTSTLEAEVGSIMGGPAYKKVRSRIEEQCLFYWTPTGQKKGRQTEARDRVLKAEADAQEAAERLAALEKTFAELESARAKLKVIERDLADDTDAEARKKLVSALEVAKSAVQLLARRRAEKAAANAKVSSLEDLQQRHETALGALTQARLDLEKIKKQRADVIERLNSGRNRVAAARLGLDQARQARQEAKAAQIEGEKRLAAQRQHEARIAALGRYEELQDLLKAHSDAKATADAAIPSGTLTTLEALEREIAQDQAVLDAGATRAVFTGPVGGISVDGEPVTWEERTLTRATEFAFGKTVLRIIPPATLEGAGQALDAKRDKLALALSELDVEDVSAARSRNDRARDAASELRALDAPIKAITPPDSLIGLAAGPDALKLLVAGMSDASAPDLSATPDLVSLRETFDLAEEAVARAEGLHESEVEALRRIEAEDAPLAKAEAGIESDLAHANSLIQAAEARPEFASLNADLAKAREEAASSTVNLADAEQTASAFDAHAIQRKIDVIDARSQTSVEARTKLLTEIVKLENTIELEGGAGLADRSAAAQEEAEAARIALQRVTAEADTLKLLRDTLDEAHNETSAQFVGPVAKRAKQHIERLLPGCELRFSEDLALVSVSRGGLPEDCEQLSKGTQEQLAILTRIAFADMLLEQGRPVSLILDDPLVYSDDGRLDTMIEILSEAATRMQVILLTCRDRAFRHVDGNRISLRN